MAQNRITHIPPRASLYYPVQPQPVEKPRRLSQRNRNIMLATVFIGFALLLFFQNVVLPWWQGIEDQWQYGDSRTFALSADVGHGGVSRFQAFDLDGQVTIIELVGHPTKYQVYVGGSLIGTDRQKRIVTLELTDVNHDGKLDLIVHVEGVMGSMVLFNTGSAFSWNSKE